MRLSTLQIAVAVACGCTQQRGTVPLEPLTLATAALPNFWLVQVAHARGYFATEGLEVTLQTHQLGKLALDALLEGRADLAACAETPVVFAELRGQHASVLASIASGTRNQAVLALKQAGISAPADVKGRRIGVTLGTTGDFFLDTFLLRHGVDRRDVRFVDLRPDQMADALARGAVDAVATWVPVTFALQARFGERLQTFYAEDLHAEDALLVGRRGFAEQRPEAARKVLRALLKAEALVRDHPEEARRSVAPVPDEEAGSLDASLGFFEFQVRLDQSLLVLMEEEARWALRSGLAPAQPPPDFLAAIAMVPLLSVRPERVGLLR